MSEPRVPANTAHPKEDRSFLLEKCTINNTWGNIKSGDIVASFPGCPNYPRVIFKQAIPLDVVVSHGQLRDLIRYSPDDKWIYLPIGISNSRKLIKINRASGKIVMVLDMNSTKWSYNSIHAIDVKYGYIALVTSKKLFILTEHNSKLLYCKSLENTTGQLNGVTLCHSGNKVFIYVAVNSSLHSIMVYEICRTGDDGDKISLRYVQAIAAGHLSAAISLGGPDSRSVNVCLDGFQQPWIGKRNDDGTLTKEDCTIDYADFKAAPNARQWSMMSSWDPTGDLLAIGCESGGYHVVSKTTKKIIHPAKRKGQQVRAIKFSPNPRVSLLAVQNSQLSIVETEGWLAEEVASQEKEEQSWRRYTVSALTWSNDGTKLLVAFRGCVVEYSVLTGVPTLCDICVSFISKNSGDAEKYGWRMETLPPDLAERCTSNV